MEDVKKRSGWWMPVCIVVIGVLLRGFYLAEISQAPEFTQPIYDPEYNAYWARGLATGDWTVPAGMTDPEIRTTPHGRPPGYPWFLAAVYTLFGVNDYAPRVAQMIIGLLNALLAYVIGRRLFGAAAGFWAGLFMAIYWVFPYFEGVLTYPSVVVLVLLLLVLALLRWHEDQRWWRLLPAGMLLGALALFRPNGLLVMPVLLLWMVWASGAAPGLRRRLVLSAAAFIAGCALVLAPAFVRNYVVARDVVFISSYGGINLYVGNHPEASLVEPRIPELMEIAGIEHWSCFDYPAIVRGLAAREGRSSMTFSEANSYFYGRAFSFIRENPGLFVRNLGRKALLFIGPHEITNDTVMEYDKRFSRVLGKLPGFPWVLALFVLGVALFLLNTPSRLRNQETLPVTFGALLLAIIAAYSLSVIIYFVAGRYRVPVLPLMFLFAGYAMARLVSMIRERRFAAAGACIASFIALAALAHLNPTGYVPSRGTWHLRRAMAYTALGQDGLARHEYQLALAYGADSSVIFANLGRLHFENNEVDEGLDMYNRGLENNPNNSVIRNNIGYELYRLGHLAAARHHLERAVAVNPRFFLAHVNLGNVLADQGETEAALGHFREAAALRPTDPAAAYNIARMLFEQGDLEAAIAQYEQVLVLAPGYVQALNNLGYCHAAQGSYEKAVPFYRLALAEDPSFLLASINLGNALLALEEYEAAVEVFKDALEHDEANIHTLYNLGRATLRVGSREQAVDALGRALAINPEFVPALVQLGVLHLEQGEAAAAAELLARAASLAPDDPGIQQHLERARILAADAAQAAQEE